MSFPTTPIPIIASTVEEDSQQTFHINLEDLEDILLHPKFADKKVCVVSVAGAFRTGKSFILNFFLRYLKWRTRASENESGNQDWLVADARLDGFSWRGGDDRDTDGILIWPEPFLMENQNGEEVVVILMDTQGIFDNISTVKSCATIFALSTLISSVQVYNINRTIQEDHLQHLQLFTEYACLAMDEYNEATPFQTLFFLVRDWSVPYEAEYGLIGGQRILEKRLEVTPKQHKELQQLRQHIKSSFGSLKCFLMPHPGLEVAISPEFRGELEKISDDFKAQLRALVPHLFDPNNLVVKAINGQQVTCRELLVYIKAYFEVFRGTELPEPKTILNATAEANNLAAVAIAKAIYIKQMEEICGGDTPFMSSAELRSEHERCQATAVQSFIGAKKMGGHELAEQFRAKLEDDIHIAFDSFVKTNNSKNLFKSVKTPAVLVTLMVINYFFQEIFQFLGLDMLASVFSLVLTIVICLLVTWTYSRYSGNLRDAAKWIDGLVNFVHSNFIAPTMTNAAVNYTMGNATLPIVSPVNSGSGISNVEGKKRN